MEAMAPHEMDQDHRQKSGREELENKVQDQIRAKEQDMRALREEIRAKENEIRKVEEELATASEAKVIERLEAKLQFLRQEIHDIRQEIRLLLVREASASAGLEGEMRIGGEIGTLVYLDHPVSKFVAALQDSNLQECINKGKSNSVIDLPKGIAWLGDSGTFSNQLFLRPCYFDLLEAKEEYFKMNSDLRAVVYTGTPGIGKSHLCAFVVARKLIAGTVVFFETFTTGAEGAKERAFYRLHLAGGVSSVHMFKSCALLDFVLSNDNAVYIVDGGSPSFPKAHVEVQVFASPSRSLFRPEKKAWTQYMYLYTPLFDLEELEKMRSLVSQFNEVSPGNLAEWFSAAGGVARTVLSNARRGLTLDQWQSAARHQILSMDTESCERMMAGLQQDFTSGSDNLFHWRVDEAYVRKKGNSPEKRSLRRFKLKALCFASNWVANEFFVKFRLEKLLNVASLIMTTSGGLELSALRGYWFEAISHMILSTGGRFRCRWLDTNVEFTLTLPKAVPYSFVSEKNASEQCRDDFSVYCVPMARNLAGIDSLSSPFLFFQMASGPRHGINEGGLDNIMKAMKKEGRCTQQAEDMVRGACDPPPPTSGVPVFVFCTTPSNFYSHYKNPRQGGKNTSGQAVLRMPIVFSENRSGFWKLASE